MYAALVKLTIDPALAPAAAAAFTSEILPGVRAAPGFVALLPTSMGGHWEPFFGTHFATDFCYQGRSLGATESSSERGLWGQGHRSILCRGSSGSRPVGRSASIEAVA
jgi:hypothetical protein